MGRGWEPWTERALVWSQAGSPSCSVRAFLPFCIEEYTHSPRAHSLWHPQSSPTFFSTPSEGQQQPLEARPWPALTNSKLPSSRFSPQHWAHGRNFVNGEWKKEKEEKEEKVLPLFQPTTWETPDPRLGLPVFKTQTQLLRVHRAVCLRHFSGDACENSVSSFKDPYKYRCVQWRVGWDGAPV